MAHVGNILLYLIGWTLFIAGQAQNSIRSKSNGLPSGFEGLKQWLDFQWLDIAHRAFWSGLFYGVIVQKTTALLQSVGFPVTSYIIAGIGGYTANAAVYQILGLIPIPGLRKEVADFVPPANAQIVPQSTPSVPNSNSGATKP
jgi:hypothetical protein